MKKLLTSIVLIALILVSCKQPLEDKLPTLTVKNQSSYVLTDVTFSGITFASSSNELPVSTQAQKEIPDDTAKTGFITFVRKDIGISCRIQTITIPDSVPGNSISAITNLESNYAQNENDSIPALPFHGRYRHLLRFNAGQNNDTEGKRGN